jgi:hypothetical protein
MRTEALIIILVVIAGSEPARLLHTTVEFVTQLIHIIGL